MNLKMIRPIDSGGFGNVDLVQDATGNVFARKTFSQNQPMSAEILANVVKRFEKEVRIQGAIQHKNVVPIVAHDLDSIPPYYLMPVAESSLAAALSSDRRLNGDFMRAIEDIVAGLEAMHAMEIFHRDLKPQNVLKFRGVNDETYYAISDFGLIAMKESRLSGLTTTGMVRGSDYYTAPEITQDLRHASAQSDIYSLGCILHEMLGDANRVPCGEIREHGPFAGIFLGCTRSEPARRFKSVREVLDAVRSVGFAPPVQPTAAAAMLLAALQSPIPVAPARWSEIADFLDGNALDSDARLILFAVTTTHIDELMQHSPGDAKRIALRYAEWTSSSAFNFDSCDVLSDRLECFFHAGDFEVKSTCLMAILELGTSHNRWYVEHKFMRLAGPAMNGALAARVAIDLRVAGPSMCPKVAHLEKSIGVSRNFLHPGIVGALGAIC